MSVKKKFLYHKGASPYINRKHFLGFPIRIPDGKASPNHSYFKNFLSGISNSDLFTVPLKLLAKVLHELVSPQIESS